MALLRLVAASLAAAVFAASTAHAQTTPSLAELAKREQERRKAVKAPAKVLTTEQVPKGSAPTPSVLPGTSADPQAQKPAEAVKEDPAQQEAAWKARMSGLREELRRNEVFAEALQTRINSLSADFTARDDPYQRQKVGEERLKALSELDRLKADIELVKKKIADAEEEARRAGVPPGWLR